MGLDVSVIIPVYNDSLNITKTLNSLVDQTFKNFEVVLVDDGSTDEIEKYLEPFLNKINLRYYFQENSGVSAARNKGIYYAKGKYISFLDSDDYHDAEYLEKMINQIKMKDSDVCYCGFKTIANNIVQKTKTKFTGNNVLEKYILRHIIFNTNSVVLNREFVLRKSILFKKNLNWAEDIDFFSRILAETNKVTYAEDYLTYYNNDAVGTRLSDFSMQKLDLDYTVFMDLCNEISNDNMSLKKAFVDYRIPGLLTYKLLLAIEENVDKNEIKEYYEKYKDYVTGFSFNNGLRSIKLNVSKIELGIKIRTL